MVPLIRAQDHNNTNKNENNNNNNTYNNYGNHNDSYDCDHYDTSNDKIDYNSNRISNVCVQGTNAGDSGRPQFTAGPHPWISFRRRQQWPPVRIQQLIYLISLFIYRDFFLNKTIIRILFLQFDCFCFHIHVLKKKMLGKPQSVYITDLKPYPTPDISNLALMTANAKQSHPNPDIF